MSDCSHPESDLHVKPCPTGPSLIACSSLSLSAVVDLCRSDPCLHGTCLAQTLNYTCVCDEGWTGVNCTEGNSIYPPHRKWRYTTQMRTWHLWVFSAAVFCERLIVIYMNMSHWRSSNDIYILACDTCDGFGMAAHCDVLAATTFLSMQGICSLDHV